MPSVLFAEKYGSLSATGQAKESSYGTPALPTGFVPTLTNTLTSDPGLFYPELMQALRDLQVYPLYGEQKNLGNVEAPMFPTNGIEYLVHAIGTDVVSGTAAPYTHTVSEANTLASMTIEKNLGNFESLQFAGARINKYSLKASAGNNAAEFTADTISQSVAILTTPSTVQVVNEEPFVFAEYSLEWQGGVIQQATNFTLDIDNALKPTYTFNQSHELQFLTPVSLQVSGTFDVVFDDLDVAPYNFFTQMQSGTEAALSFTLAHPSSGGSVQLTMPSVRLSKTSQDAKPKDIVTETINFEARYNPGSTDLYTIQAIIQNGVDTAY